MKNTVNQLETNQIFTVPQVEIVKRIHHFKNEKGEDVAYYRFYAMEIRPNGVMSIICEVTPVIHRQSEELRKELTKEAKRNLRCACYTLQDDDRGEVHPLGSGIATDGKLDSEEVLNDVR